MMGAPCVVLETAPVVVCSSAEALVVVSDVKAAVGPVPVVLKQEPRCAVESAVPVSSASLPTM